MTIFFSSAAAFILIAAVTALLTKSRLRDILRSDYALIIAAGLLARVLASFVTEGFPTDISCWRSWGEMLRNNGFGSFYTSGATTDYPPMYMYILYLLSCVRELFRIDIYGAGYVFLLKLPAIICDILTVCFAYFIVSERRGKKAATAVSILLVVNPAVILNSSVWGQVDSILALVLVLSLYYLTEKRTLASVLLFMAAILLKPQALIAAPVYLYDFYIYLKDNNYSPKSFLTLLQYGLFCILSGAALCLPFALTPYRLDFMPVLRQFVSTLASYPYISVNAYNIYSLFGLNWVTLNTNLLFIPYSIIGTAAIVLITLASFLLLHKSKARTRYYMVTAFLYFATFMLSTKMHERYSFPAIILLFFAFSQSLNKKTLISYIGISAAFFLNCVDILLLYLRSGGLDSIYYTSRIFSGIYFIVFAVFLYNFSAESRQGNEINLNVIKEPAPLKPAFVTGNEKNITKRDLLIIAVITTVYSIISFYHLGNIKSAQNPYGFGNEPVIADFGEDHSIKKFQFFLSANHDKDLKLTFSSDGISFGDAFELNTTYDQVFKWTSIDLDETARYVKIEAGNTPAVFFEFAFRDELNKLIPIASVTDGAEALFDEQKLVPEHSTYMDSAYFDEIYHPRSAYEFVMKASYIYEWTHPPLGKLIIAAGIKIFGLSPFGWRFMGNLFGILMIPLIYLFAKRVFKKSFWAMFTALIFTFDFMHFAQTRIGTIDTYITFFVIAMYYFMYIYYDNRQSEWSFKTALLPLLLSGICMGLGIACKWPGVYAGAGLAVIFFIALWHRHRDYLLEKAEGTADARLYRKRLIITLACCIVFFVIIPVFIYLASYIPYYRFGGLVTSSMSGLNGLSGDSALFRLLSENKLGSFLSAVVREQIRIYNYHAKLISVHPYSSVWWQWPILYRPIWYYSGSVTETIRMGISSFGNPAVWWTGIAAFIYGIYRFITSKDRLAAFLMISYLAQYLPWALVERTTYIYHYFPSVPFVTLMICYMFANLDFKKHKWLIIGYLALTVGLFALFYPVLSGLPIDTGFVQTFLKWLEGWVLI